ncbi:MAG: Mfa1 fimbrilin C-terminal domain-containing protein [Tidjanibacter sp.]|nr:Mfa1 fimbrilin C-terminal domain-containing protein [Tidjanibacter sp.]
MKKYLFIALAALGFAACENGTENVKPGQSGELEQSYVAISLAADELTKAADGVYEEGTSEERAIQSAYVFFFKEGAAFPVSFDGTTTSANALANNYLEVDLTGNGKDMDNVSDIKDAVLVLQNYKGEYPDQIVAVLNWDPTAQQTYTLAELQAIVSTLGDETNGLVMSNAVYADSAAQVIDAVDLTINNIGKTEAEALANPVTIYVERIAAKVVFTAENNGLFDIDESIEGESVYAKITGFELYNDYEESWLIKKIDPTWSNLGFNWNDADWYRSYWATSLDDTFPENKFAWSTDNTAIDGYVYCGENTRTWTEANDVRTKVIVKAQLVHADGTTPFEVVNWFGKDYVGEDNLKIVVANTLMNTYFFEDGANYTGILPGDIECIARDVTEENSYEVYFQLSPAGQAKTWYKYENGAYTAFANTDALDTELAEVQPAFVYNDGMTYYTTNIKHLGAAGKTAEYGVVRNHVYKVNISEIKGYGTPVYNGTTDLITPEKPEDIKTYVSAQIKVLSWRIVEHDYPLN